MTAISSKKLKSVSTKNGQGVASAQGTASNNTLGTPSKSGGSRTPAKAKTSPSKTKKMKGAPKTKSTPAKTNMGAIKKSATNEDDEGLWLPD